MLNEFDNTTAIQQIEQHISDVKEHWTKPHEIEEELHQCNKWLETLNSCEKEEPLYFSGIKSDPRILGDNYSAITVNVELLCCADCCRTYADYQRVIARRMRRIVGRDETYPFSAELKNHKIKDYEIILTKAVNMNDHEAIADIMYENGGEY